MHSEHTNGVIEVDSDTLTNAVAIAAGHLQALILQNDGAVIAFGRRLGGGSDAPAGLSNVVKVAVEGNSCWAIRRDGTVVQWGGDQDDANIVAGLSNVTSVVWAGYRSYLALKSDGTVVCFRFDNPTGKANPNPVRLVAVGGEALQNVAGLASMGDSPAILKTDGSVMSLGNYRTMIQSDFGSRRSSYQQSSEEVVSVDGGRLTNVLAIAGGGGHCLALKADGKVVAWGNNLSGETKVPAGLSNVVSIATAEHLSLALKRDGTVAAWGGNFFGQASVPVGLSNVVAIASGGWFGLALTTGSVPSSVFTYPHGQLEKMEREADLIFKGRVLSTTAVTNGMFPPWANTHAARFSVISVLKGNTDTNEVVLWHITKGPMFWGGGTIPSSHQFEPGRSYLVFAARLDKSAYLYSPPPDATNRLTEFRQLYYGGVARTLNAEPISTPSVKDAHWAELNLLLNDTSPSNQIYAIEQLDSMSFARRGNDEWSRSQDFKRKAVLSVLLPLLTNSNEQVAARAIGCFATESNAAAGLVPFVPALVQVANEDPSARCRLGAISALSGLAGEAVSNSLTRLLTNSDDNIRVGAVYLLPRFPTEFSEQALRKSAEDESANVRSVVANVIGNEKLVRLLPTLTKLFSDPVGRDPLIKPLTMEYLQAGMRWSNIGDVHTSAGLALVKFDPNQVADILKTNLNDPGFHINFVSKLAETNAEPWLPELVSILEARKKFVEDFSKLPPSDPRKYSEPASDKILIGTYAKCWEDIRQHLLQLPKDKCAEMGKYMELLERMIQTTSMTSHDACSLYELYRTQGLKQRAKAIRRSYPSEGWWFDSFDEKHEDL